nr:MAG: hypothetical protein [Bacteriophage sp.]
MTSEDQHIVGLGIVDITLHLCHASSRFDGFHRFIGYQSKPVVNFDISLCQPFENLYDLNEQGSHSIQHLRDDQFDRSKDGLH